MPINVLLLSECMVVREKGMCWRAVFVAGMPKIERRLSRALFLTYQKPEKFQQMSKSIAMVDVTGMLSDIPYFVIYVYLAKRCIV